MSKKSVVIALPPRVVSERVEEKREADGWVSAAVPEQPSALPPGFGQLDLRADRSPFELVWMIWTFPALATLHWMTRAVGQGTSK